MKKIAVLAKVHDPRCQGVASELFEWLLARGLDPLVDAHLARHLLIPCGIDQALFPGEAELVVVLGGALGNILDRTLHGYVVDFLDLHFGEFRPFLVFNVGDAAISIAVVILLLRAFLTRKDRAEGSGPEETIEHA